MSQGNYRYFGFVHHTERASCGHPRVPFLRCQIKVKYRKGMKPTLASQQPAGGFSHSWARRNSDGRVGRQIRGLGFGADDSLGREQGAIHCVPDILWQLSGYDFTTSLCPMGRQAPQVTSHVWRGAGKEACCQRLEETHAREGGWKKETVLR